MPLFVRQPRFCLRVEGEALSGRSDAPAVTARLLLEPRAGAERLRSIAVPPGGLLLREIGAALGVSAKTVHAWLSDPKGLKARERKRRYLCEVQAVRRGGCWGFDVVDM